jgi:hypothetical protein
VRVVCEPGATSGYAWGRKAIRFVRCNDCGCITHYERPDGSPERSIGVNARIFEPAALGAVRIRRLDGASSWKYLD